MDDLIHYYFSDYTERGDEFSRDNKTIYLWDGKSVYPGRNYEWTHDVDAVTCKDCLRCAIDQGKQAERRFNEIS